MNILKTNSQTNGTAIAKNIQETAALFSIPRHYPGLSQSVPMIVHVFADASIKAYGTVTNSLQNNHVSSILSKTRVVTLKHLTLKLSAALLTSRLADFIQKSLSLQIKFTSGLITKLSCIGLLLLRNFDHLF